MNPPTKKAFRVIVVIGTILQIFATYSSPEVDGEMERAGAWTYYGSILPESVLVPLWDIYAFLNVFFYILLALFFSWARWLLVASFILGQLLVLGSGVYVTYPLESVRYSIAGGFLWLALVLSFFKPCAFYFTPRGPFDRPVRSSEEAGPAI